MTRNRDRWILSLLVALVVTAASAVQLRHTLTVGSTARYRESMTAKGSLTVNLGGQQTRIPVEAEATELRAVTVKADAGNGEFWVESRSLEAKATVTTQGETQRQDVPGTSFRVRMDTLGDVKEIRQLEAGGQGDEMSLDLKLDSLLQSARLTGFPAGDIQPGATWEKSVPLPGGQGQATVSSQLNRLTEGGRFAEIASTYSVPIPPTSGTMRMGAMEIPVRVQGHSKGRSITTWDVAAGRAAKTTGRGEIDIELFLMGLPGDPAKGSFQVDYGIELQQ